MKDALTVLPREFSADSISKNYAKIALFYDFWSGLTESKAFGRVLELACIRDGEQVLEVAVATGLVFADIVSRNKNGLNVGIDISSAMLSRAQKRMKENNARNFRLELGNAYHLAFEANSFDLIINNFMLDLLPERDFLHILSGFYRVLKPSGRLVISTMTFGKKWYHGMWYWLAKNFPSLLTQCRPVILHDYLKEAGFVNISSEILSQSTFPSELFRVEKH